MGGQSGIDRGRSHMAAMLVPADVRYAPLATEDAWRYNMSRRANSGRSAMQQIGGLFDHLIGEREHVVGYREIHRLCGFQIDDE